MAVALVCGTCATTAPVAAAADAPTAASINPATYSFITAPTDELGVPGYAAGAELTPSMGIDTGQGEVDFSYGAGQRSLPILGRTRADGRAPVFLAHLSSGDVRYGLTVLSAPVADEPVSFVGVTMHNLGQRAATAAWGSHLVYSGGNPLADNQFADRITPLIAADPTWTYMRTGTTLTRSGQVMEITPSGGSGTGADVTYRRQLAPGASWTLQFAVPTDPLDPASPAVAQIIAASLPAELSAVGTAWAGFFASAMQISLPETKVTNTFYASLANMEESRYPSPAGQSGWIQTPNKLQYNTFFIRDAAFIARAFDVAGLHSEAEQDLDFFPQVQTAAGQFLSQTDELDGQGEALWAIGQHAEWPGADSVAFAQAMLPAVQAGVNWLARACGSDPDGLVPVSTVVDNELASGHITGDDFLAADGLAAAIKLALTAGRSDLAALWQQQLSTFDANLRAALSTAEAMTGGWIPPTLEDNGGQNWGNLWATYPSAVALSPDSPAVTATLAYVTRGFRQGIATYQGMLHDYLGYRVFETELQRGQQGDVVNGLYAELAHTTATGGGFETDLGPGNARTLLLNLAPHGWFAAEYVTLLRNMLVIESGNKAVNIMSAVSPDWLQPGDQISVRDAPTTAGTVSYTLVSVTGGARLTWSADLAPGVVLRWPLPVATGLHRTLTLSGHRGTLIAHWHLHGSVPSFAKTAAGVLALYTHRN